MASDLDDKEAKKSRMQQFLLAQEGAEDASLNRSLSVAAQRNPDEYAKVVDISTKTGIPFNIVEREQPRLESLLKEEEMKGQLADSPTTRKKMLDPAFAAQAQDDVSGLSQMERQIRNSDASYWENLKLSWAAGEATTKGYQIGMERYEGIAQQLLTGVPYTTPPETLKQLEATNRNASHDTDYSFIPSIPMSAAKQGALYWEIAKSSAEGAFEIGAPVAMANAGLALWYGQLGPQLFTPEEMYTVPAAFTAGLVVAGGAGAKYGGIKEMFRAEAGGALNEFLTPDEQGRVMDNETAFYAATAAGAINAGWEYASLRLLGGTFTGAKQVIRARIRKELMSEGGKELIMKLAGRYTASVMGEGAEEILQKYTTAIAGEIGKLSDDGDFANYTPEEVADKIFSKELLFEALEEGGEAVKASILLSGPGTVISATAQISEFKRAKSVTENEQTKLTGLIDIATESTLRKRSPSEFKALIRQIEEESGEMADVYISVEEAYAWIEAEGIDVNNPPNTAVAQIVAQLTAKMNVEEADSALVAQETGVDIAVSAADFMTYMPDSKSFESLRAHIKMSQNSFTQAEVADAERNYKARIKELMASADEHTGLHKEAKEIYEQIRSEIVATGTVTDKEAELQARIIPAIITTMAAQAGPGISISDIYGMLPLSVFGPNVKAPAGTTVNQVVSMDERRLTKLQEEIAGNQAELAEIQAELDADDMVMGAIYGEKGLDLTDDAALDARLEEMRFTNGLNPNQDFEYSPDTKSSLRDTGAKVDTGARREQIRNKAKRNEALRAAQVEKQGQLIEKGAQETELMGQIAANASRGELNQSEVVADQKDKAESRGFDTSEVLYHATPNAANISEFKVGQGDYIGSIGIWFDKDPGAGYDMLFGPEKPDGYGVIPVYAKRLPDASVLTLDHNPDDINILREAKANLETTEDELAKAVAEDAAARQQYAAEPTNDAYGDSLDAANDALKVAREAQESAQSAYDEGFENDPYAMLEQEIWADMRLEPGTRITGDIAQNWVKEKGYRKIVLNGTMADRTEPRQWVVMTNPADVRSIYGEFKEPKTVAEFKAMAASADLLYQSMYHGSPYLFDAFDMDKIGTGEGAQAFGWGLYFAEQHGVARGYSRITDADLGLIVYMDGKPIPDTLYSDMAGTGLAVWALSHNGDVASAIKVIETRDDSAYGVAPTAEEKAAAIELLKSGRFTAEAGGHVYEVDISDDAVAKMLDWDGSLMSQPKAVIDAINNLPGDIKDRIFGERDGFPARPMASMKGEEFYFALLNALADKNLAETGEYSDFQAARNASEYLLGLGIPGIKYFDGMSRNTGDGTHNVVTFSTAPITIKSVDGKAVSKAESDVVLDQTGLGKGQDTGPKMVGKEGTGKGGKRASITFMRDTQTAVMSLKEAADRSSFLHEGAHWYLELMSYIATDPRVAPELLEQADAILKFLEVDDFSQIQTIQHEKFAQAFEIYLMEGKAPSLALRKAFRAFSHWLTQIYAAISQQPIKLDKESRAMFDRMLATEEEIELANTTMRYEQTLAKIEASGLDKREVAEQLRIETMANDEAKEKLRVRLLRQLRRRTEKWWRTEKQALIAELVEELRATQPYMAMEFLLAKKPPAGFAQNKLDKIAVYKLMGWRLPKNWKAGEPTTALEFIANHGGINRDEAARSGIDPGNWAGKNNPANYPSFGKPLFRAKGGMSMDEAGQLLWDAGYMGSSAGILGDMSADRTWGDDGVMAILEKGLMGEHTLSVTDSEFIDAAAEAEYNARYGEETPSVDNEQLPDASPRMNGMMAVGGEDPQILAERLGFASADELIQSIINAPPLKAAATREAESRMVIRHGDILNDGTLELEAIAAAHNPTRARLLLRELNSLARQANKAAVERDAAQKSARRIIAGLKLSEIRPEAFHKAEIRAAIDFADAMAKGDVQAAYAAKKRQYMNNLLWKESYRARKKVTSHSKRFKQYRKTKYTDRTRNPEHTTHLKLFLGAFDFDRNNTDERSTAEAKLAKVRDFIIAYNKNVDSRSQIVGTITGQDGTELSSDLLTKPLHMSELTVGQVEELRGIVDSIFHAAQSESALEKAIFKQRMQGHKVDIVNNALDSDSASDRAHEEENTWTETKRWGRMAAAAHRKFESFARQMDGYKDLGKMWKEIVEPLLNAARREMVMHDEAYVKLKDIYGTHKDIFHPWQDKRTFKLESGHKLTLSLGGRMALALNWGNFDNQQAILNSNRRPMTKADVGKIINTLTDEQWNLVEETWAFIDSYWEQIAELEESITGVKPKRVEADSFTLASGRIIKGGYYPIMADRRVSYFGRADEISTRAGAVVGGVATRAHTSHNHTIERVGFGKQTVDLSMAGLFRHIDKVIHDLSHREAVRHVDRVLHNDDIRTAAIKSLGDEGYKSLVAKLQGVAAGFVHPSELQWAEKIMRHARLGITLGSLGFSLKTMISQTFGLSTAIAEIGEANMVKYTTDFMSAPIENAKEIQRLSIMMKERVRYMNRDAAAIFRDLKGVGKLEQVKEASFLPLLMGDYAISLPTWWAAYHIGLENKANPANEEFLTEQDAINFADRMVYRTQQSGMLMDLSAVEQQNEFVRMFSMMYSAFNAIYQIALEHVHKYKLGNISAMRLAADLMWIFVVTGVADELLNGDDDDDNDWPGEDYAKSIAGYAFGTMVGLRELSFYMKSGRIGDTPIAATIKAPGDFAKQVGQGEFDEALVSSGLKLASMVGHVPGTGQANRMAKYIFALEKGETDGFNPYHFLFTGPPRGGKKQDDTRSRERREPRSGRDRDSRRQRREPRERR